MKSLTAAESADAQTEMREEESLPGHIQEQQQLPSHTPHKTDKEEIDGPSLKLNTLSPPNTDAPTAPSPTAFLTSKLADARWLLSSLRSPSSSSSSPLAHTLNDLSSSLRTEVESALDKTTQELRDKLVVVEGDLRDRVRQLEQEASEKQAQLKESFQQKQQQLEQKFTLENDALVTKLRAEYALKKREVTSAALQRFERLLVRVLDERVLPSLQRSLLDPLMPLPLQQLLLELLDAVWPEVKEELFQAWHDICLEYLPIEVSNPPGRWWANPLRSLRASFLYHTYPFDASLWESIRRPAWWMWTLVAAFPLWGVQAAYFLMVFCLLDHADEYQMVQFILQFKGMQCVTLGIMNCMIGAAMYVQCVSVEPASIPPVLMGAGGSEPYHLHRCDQSGPGALPGFYADLILFAVQSITIWLAMGFLPSTKKKGVRTLAPTSPQRSFEPSELARAVPTSSGLLGRGKVYGGMGGKLRMMVMIDAAIFVLICAAVVLLLFTRPYDVLTPGAFSTFEWLFRSDLFWLKTLYGLASFPFLFFLLPVVSSLLLHTRPTGYNRAGVCVPKVGAEKSKEMPEALRRREEKMKQQREKEQEGNGATVLTIDSALASPSTAASPAAASSSPLSPSVPSSGRAWPPSTSSPVAPSAAARPSHHRAQVADSSS